MISELRRYLEEELTSEKLLPVKNRLGVQELKVEVSETMDSSINGRVYIPSNGTNGYTNIGSFNLSLLPGDGDVLVSHGVWVSAMHRGRGLGGFFHNARLNAARKAGCSAITCTVRAENEVEKRILSTNNWHRMGSYSVIWSRPSNLRYTGPLYVIEFWMKEL